MTYFIHIAQLIGLIAVTITIIKYSSYRRKKEYAEISQEALEYLEAKYLKKNFKVLSMYAERKNIANEIPNRDPLRIIKVSDQNGIEFHVSLKSKTVLCYNFDDDYEQVKFQIAYDSKIKKIREPIL